MTGTKEIQMDEDQAVETAIRKFIELDRHYTVIKQWLDDYKQAKKAFAEAVGIGNYYADDEGIVYKPDVIDGKFVYFDPIDIKRTKRESETRGTLSMKEAAEAGFGGGE